MNQTGADAFTPMATHTADECRLYAEECRFLAGLMPDATHKEMTLGMADDWERQANKTEHPFVKRACPGFP